MAFTNWKRARLGMPPLSMSGGYLPGPQPSIHTPITAADETRALSMLHDQKQGYVPSGNIVYYNVSISGSPSIGPNNPDVLALPAIAAKDETYPQPLLERCDEWQMSVIRFKVPTAYVPLFTYTQALEPCIVTMVAPGVNAVSTTIALTADNPELPVDVFSVQDWVDATNVALNTCYTTFRTNGFGGSPGFAPFVSYNPSTGLMTIQYEQTWWSPDADNGFNTGNTGSLFFNFNLYETFYDSFQGTYSVPNAAGAAWPVNQDVKILLKEKDAMPTAAAPQIVCQTGGLTAVGTTCTWANAPVQHGLSVNGVRVNNTVIISGASPAAYNGIFTVASTPSATTFTYVAAGAPGVSPATGTPTMVAAPRGSQIPGQYNSVTQETPSVASWDQFVNLRFTTQSVPVRPEWLPVSGASPSQIGTRQILTDFNPSFSDQVDTRNYLQYFPQGPWRMMDMISAEPLRRFDIQALWVDRGGAEHQMTIPNGETMDIKIAFVKKH